MNAALERIRALFPLEKCDAGEFARFKAGALSVEIEWYRARGLGNVSLVRGKAMLGLMRMDTLVINPVERDMPLFSYDLIDAMGKRTVLVEYYDTLAEPTAFREEMLNGIKSGLADLPEHDLGKHWYDPLKLAPSFAKKVKRAQSPRLEGAFLFSLERYLAMAAAMPPLAGEERARKQTKAAAYVNDLLQNGGPSTDAFAKAIGKERTRALFTRVVFGTEE